MMFVDGVNLDDDRAPAGHLLWRTTRMATYCTGTEIYSRTDVRLLVLKHTRKHSSNKIVLNKKLAIYINISFLVI